MHSPASDDCQFRFLKRFWISRKLWIAKARSIHAYFLTCVFVSHHYTVRHMRANTKKVGAVCIYSIASILRSRQCVSWRTCPRKLRMSLRMHQATLVGGPTELDGSFSTWRSYSHHINLSFLFSSSGKPKASAMATTNTFCLFILIVTKLYRSGWGDVERSVLLCMWGHCFESMDVMQIHV